MSENSPMVKKNTSLDWFLRGALAKIGEAFDRLTGRNWQPSSNLATSELIEQLKILLDSKVRDSGARGRFVPHKLSLKMQWNKFSADSEESAPGLEKLHHELLTAAVDHINDRRYHTFAPLELEIKQDYFTEGIKLSASFADVGNDDAEMNVKVPEIKIGDFAPTDSSAETRQSDYIAVFSVGGTEKQTKLVFENNKRLTVGRTAESDLSLPDASVSKIHASLLLNAENQLVIADTGSSNGTFIDDQRIPYGKAQIIEGNGKVKFGNVEVTFLEQERAVRKSQFVETITKDSVVIGDLEFKSKANYQPLGSKPNSDEIK